MELRKLISEIIANDDFHARWINTLSFLEHIGSRKIMKSQVSQQLTLIVLQHLSEETKHSFFFKKLCDRHFPGQCPNFESIYLLGGSAPSNYFQKLDEFVEKSLKGEVQKSVLNYLYVTWLIEERALKVYELYSELLEQFESPIKLTAILVEEREHLNDTSNLLLSLDKDFRGRGRKFRDSEQLLFEELLISIVASLNAKVSFVSEVNNDI